MNFSEDVDNHIYIASRNIIKSTFNIDISDNISKYYSVIDNNRINEIKQYKFHGLISPTIFNICFFILTKDYGIEKMNAIKALEKLVEQNKRIMDSIILPSINIQENAINKNDANKKRKHCGAYNTSTRRYDNVLKGIYLSNNIEEINTNINKIQFDMGKYMQLVNADSKSKLRYNDNLMLLVYRAKGMDKEKYIENYNRILEDILQLVNDRENYSQEVEIKNKKMCPKCSGTGYIDYYYYIDDGVCYMCDGSGKLNYE